MKRILAFVIVLSFSVVMPITSYNDLDKLLLVTSIVIDKTNSDTYSIYFEAFTPATSTSGMKKEGERSILHLYADNVTDLITKVNAQSNLKLNFTHNRIIFFTERAASDGIDNILDVFSRGEEFLKRSFIAIFHGDPEKLYSLNLTGEKFFGLSVISQLSNTRKLIGVTEDMTIIRLHNESSLGSKTCIIPTIKIVHKPNADYLDFKGSGILRNYKLIGELNDTQTIYTNFLLNRIITTGIETINPSSDNKSMGLRVTKAKTKTKYNYSNGQFHISKYITVHSIARGSFGKIELSNENVKKIEKEASSRLKDGFIKLFTDNKEKGIDILNVQEDFYRHYPKYSKTNILDNTELIVNVNVIVDISTDPKDFN
ncbi:Ger(x)C family spore germination protein [Candidatus Clostridium radicumherbarum]|uniref:Ger(X)C family spore germination protein n=1 Tax=Candidatus Clostridium radicumherbarum TaxID=3381662 RepID=A0ABW8TU31_9CLOT